MENLEETQEREIDYDKYFNEIKKLANDMMTEIDYSTKIKSEIREDAYIILDAIVNQINIDSVIVCRIG